MNLSKERKELQKHDLAPAFWNTAGWQVFKSKYLFDADTPRDQYMRIASTLAEYVEGHYPHWWPECGYSSWKEAFFQEMWQGYLSPSTPVISNCGTTRGMPVSCSGSYMDNSIHGIYEARKEIAILTKHGFGTSVYAGDISQRGDISNRKFVTSGVTPIAELFAKDMSFVGQGGSRRGSCALYLPLLHGDSLELIEYLREHPDGLNIGFNWGDAFTTALNNKDEHATKVFKELMRTKMQTGKGYISFIDKVNRRRPQAYINNNLDFKASNLCAEITLHSSPDYTYTCVLSNLNLVHWEHIKNSRSAFIAKVFLDCV